MKIFQILNDFCHWDATRKHPTIESTNGLYAPDIVFVEAPDYVFEGWGYADGEFIKPINLDDNWYYEESTGIWKLKNPEEYFAKPEQNTDQEEQ